MSEEIEFTLTKPLTELQLTKDSSIQSIPLTNETYIKQLILAGVGSIIVGIINQDK